MLGVSVQRLYLTVSPPKNLTADNRNGDEGITRRGRDGRAPGVVSHEHTHSMKREARRADPSTITEYESAEP